MNSSDRPDKLASVVREWTVAPPRNPEFRGAVWSRIEAGAASLPWGAYVRQHARIVGGALAMAAVIGALAGREQARTRVASESDRLASAYVQALDARQMRMP